MARVSSCTIFEAHSHQQSAPKARLSTTTPHTPLSQITTRWQLCCTLHPARCWTRLHAPHSSSWPSTAVFLPGTSRYEVLAATAAVQVSALTASALRTACLGGFCPVGPIIRSIHHCAFSACSNRCLPKIYPCPLGVAPTFSRPRAPKLQKFAARPTSLVAAAFLVPGLHFPMAFHFTRECLLACTPSAFRRRRPMPRKRVFRVYSGRALQWLAFTGCQSQSKRTLLYLSYYRLTSSSSRLLIWFMLRRSLSLSLPQRSRLDSELAT